MRFNRVTDRVERRLWMNGVLLLIMNQRGDVIVPGIERLDVGKDQNESV